MVVLCGFVMLKAFFASSAWVWCFMVICGNFYQSNNSVSVSVSWFLIMGEGDMDKWWILNLSLSSRFLLLRSLTVYVICKSVHEKTLKCSIYLSHYDQNQIAPCLESQSTFEKYEDGWSKAKATIAIRMQGLPTGHYNQA